MRSLSEPARPLLLHRAGASFRSGVARTGDAIRRIARWIYSGPVLRASRRRVRPSEWGSWLQASGWFIPGVDRLAEKLPFVVEHLLTAAEFLRRVIPDLARPVNVIRAGYKTLTELVAWCLVRTAPGPRRFIGLKPRSATLRFMRAFLSRPMETGSLVPSSRYLTERMLQSVDWQRARVIVELGPGTGCFTAQILARMDPSATLIAIDTNEEFIAELRRTFPDPRLHIIHGSAVELKVALRNAGEENADCIISGLPFAAMRPRARLAILNACREVLHPEGLLILFQYRRLLLPFLEALFDSVERDYELLNLPPAHVFCCNGVA